VALALGVCPVGCSGSSAFGPVTHTQNPLVAQYMVSPPPGSTAAVEFGLDTHYGRLTSAVSATAAVPTVPILVAGMKQNSTYHMRAVITHADGTQVLDSDYVFATGSAPAGRIPLTTLTLPAGARPSLGVKLMALNPTPNNAGNSLRIVATDPAGELIWYYDFDPALGTAQPIKLLPNGHLLMVLFGGTTGPGGMVREIDLAGQTIHEFTVDQLNQWLAAAGYSLQVNAIHHDIAELPNGHLLLLVNTRKKLPKLPGYRKGITVLGDGVIDLAPNYTPVWAWSSFDHLDVNRHPMKLPDWTHANTVLYSPDDGNVVLSMRHQSWLVKIDYANGRGTGKILWRLGYQGDFTLLNSTSPADWFFAQHSGSFVTSKSSGDFELALFDNGNDRVSDSRGTTCRSIAARPWYRKPDTFGRHFPACYSRPAIFDVNESARTAQLEWSSVVPYSYWGGANMELPNGNMFVDVTSTPYQPVDNPKPTVVRMVIKGLLVVILVLLIFFWRIPTAVIPFLTIPILLILAFVPTLGAIALVIGFVVDSMVVVMSQESVNSNSGKMRVGDFRSEVIAGLKRINRPSFFVLVAIGASFLPMFQPQEKLTARVMEVTRQQPSQLVWELDVIGQESYRAVHLPSLYPGVQW